MASLCCLPLPFHPDSSDSLHWPSSWFPCDFVRRTTISLLHPNGFFFVGSTAEIELGGAAATCATHSRELTHTI